MHNAEVVLLFSRKLRALKGAVPPTRTFNRARLAGRRKINNGV